MNMRTFNLFLVFIVCTLSVFARNIGVITDETGKLVKPKQQAFVEQNNLVSTLNLSVFVDLYRDGVDDVASMPISSGRSVYWSDCELKVLDKDGKIIYFFSTIAFGNRQVQELHKGDVNDFDATVYYYVSGAGDNACVKPKKKLTNYNSSIGAIEKAHSGTSGANDNRVRITAIQIYPSAKFRDYFLNPDNSIMVWRQSLSLTETDGQGNKVWRPAIIQFIR